MQLESFETDNLFLFRTKIKSPIHFITVLFWSPLSSFSTSKMESFALEAMEWGPRRNHTQEFGFCLQYVNPVNHGEFEDATDQAMAHASYGDNETPERPSTLAIQRCRGVETDDTRRQGHSHYLYHDEWHDDV